jgi:ribosomal protein S18 acetylase RimI-like enzyme
VTADVADDPSLVQAMSEAGCTGVFLGLESLNQASLAEAGKRNASTKRYAGQIAVFHDRHIQVNASFVFGFDHDDRGTFERTVAWIERQRLACATFHILTPYPGTPLFRKLDREGRILTRDWSRFDTGHAVFVPKLMSPEDLEEGYAWWLGRERERPGAVVLVAARGESVEGYAYGTLEERDWNLLLDVHGAIHDVFVSDAARRHGVGRRLVEAMIAELEALGAPRIVLSTMVGNSAAQRLFTAAGFRPTMLEMTR